MRLPMKCFLDCQIRFDHGVIDEYLFLDLPNESRLPNGLMLLEHTKVVQKSVYEHLHFTHEGHLRIIFTPELKIMSWEFCSRRHEEYITRRVLAPQVSNLLQVAQKYQAASSESGPAGVSNNDAQTICNMFVTASRQLAKNLEPHTLNEHGLSKRYACCLQISEVVNHMKDLIEFTNKNNLGPIDHVLGVCSRQHEEYITRRVLAPHVNNLLQVAQKYQATSSESGPAGVSNNDAQTICNMFVTASWQLAKNHTLNEHGLSKRYACCLQISEVVNHMKDLIEFTNKNNLGPIEGLKNYPKQNVPKLPGQNSHKAKQIMAAAGLPNDQNTTKIMGVKQE